MRQINRAFLVLSVMAAFTAPAFANFGGGAFRWGGGTFDAVAQISLSWNGANEGGPFSVNLVSGSLDPSKYSAVTAPASNVYSTFCIEHDQHFSPGGTYWVSIDDRAYSGGAGASGKQVNDVTEWIYDGYLNGNPSGWSHADISKAIWWAQGQSAGVKNGVADAALAALGYNASSTFGAADHTFALNLWNGFREVTENGVTSWVADTDAQSQLITMDPSNTPPAVPAPGAVLLAVVGLGGLRGARRYFA
jgi:hypothetical protein